MKMLKDRTVAQEATPQHPSSRGKGRKLRVQRGAERQPPAHGHRPLPTALCSGAPRQRPAQAGFIEAVAAQTRTVRGAGRSGELATRLPFHVHASIFDYGASAAYKLHKTWLWSEGLHALGEGSSSPLISRREEKIFKGRIQIIPAKRRADCLN